MIRTIQITEQELKDLKLIRNYFGEHDKTPLEHLAYIELDKLVKKLQQADVSGSLPSDSEVMKAAKDYGKECYTEKRKIAETGFIACWKWFRAWRQ